MGTPGCPSNFNGLVQDRQAWFETTTHFMDCHPHKLWGFTVTLLGVPELIAANISNIFGHTVELINILLMNKLSDSTVT